MKPTANSNLYLCPEKRRMYLPYFRESVDYYDCALELHADGGYTFQQYELPPYKVVIRSPRIYIGQSGTYVTKIKEIVYDNHLGMTEPFTKWEDVWTADSDLSLPWNDYNKCIEKLKLLTTFS